MCVCVYTRSRASPLHSSRIPLSTLTVPAPPPPFLKLLNHSRRPPPSPAAAAQRRRRPPTFSARRRPTPRILPWCQVHVFLTTPIQPAAAPRAAKGLPLQVQLAAAALPCRGPAWSGSTRWSRTPSCLVQRTTPSWPT